MNRYKTFLLQILNDDKEICVTKFNGYYYYDISNYTIWVYSKPYRVYLLLHTFPCVKKTIQSEYESLCIFSKEVPTKS